jgi:amphi-Trp domain-containing protein
MRKRAVMKSDRDIDKVYAIREYVTKLRRLADALESEKPFVIQIAGERIFVPADAVYSVEHEREDGREEIEFQISWSNEDASRAELDGMGTEDPV